ncbi:hypothetical protein [Pedobacter sp. SL55]|uniref:hypothetical protein n=1 Tax=Pedobacter sp. SL55 TaxID=2995161 RepID=UPI00226F20CA|nr:hypothetical protein [Pedobacter sp. SL55]WAC42235.1 hypothetical protein OVA16_07735 [Pedobacter sp. SL55]
MPLNLIKVYPALLEIVQLNEKQRTLSLLGVFKNNIEENTSFKFRAKQIRPLKKEEGVSAMELLFRHLTTVDDLDNKGKKTGTRSFELARSQRLHWIKHHIDERKVGNIEVFSYEDRVNGKSINRTYIYDVEQEYVIILEPQRSGMDYYLLTAYHLNQPGGKKQILNKLKKKLSNVL